MRFSRRLEPHVGPAACHKPLSERRDVAVVLLLEDLAVHATEFHLVDRNPVGNARRHAVARNHGRTFHGDVVESEIGEVIALVNEDSLGRVERQLGLPEHAVVEFDAINRNRQLSEQLYLFAPARYFVAARSLWLTVELLAQILKAL